MLRYSLHLIVSASIIFTLCLIVVADDGPGMAYLSSKSWTPTIKLFEQFSCAIDGHTYLPRHEHTLVSQNLAIEEGQHKPWSYVPLCASELGPLNEVFCVYTSNTFHNGQGISVITTQDIARMLSKRPQFSESAAYLDSSSDLGDPIASFLGTAGQELRATRLIEEGERILVDTAVTLVHDSFSKISWEEREELLRVAISRLPVSTQRRIQHFSSFPDQIDFHLAEMMWAHAGFRANVSDASHTMLFLDVSLINHSCAPSSHRKIVSDSFEAIIVAARDIEMHEEITNSYVYDTDPKILFQTTAKRQQTIQDSLYFKCQCHRCQDGEAADKVLKKLLNHQHFLEEHREDFKSEIGVSQANLLTALYRAAGLDTLLHIPYRFSAHAYASIGQEEDAKKWRGKAAALLSLSNLPADSD